VTRRPDLQVIATGASPIEIAVIVGALEMSRHAAATAVASAATARTAPVAGASRWLRAGLIEGVDRDPASGLDRLDGVDASRECD
jgi:hypothetical protein